MRAPLRPLVVAASIAALALAGALSVPIAASAAAPGNIRITEWEYNGSEFIEFTNLDSVAIPLTGWSFSNAAGAAGDVPLDSLGTVVPGESFVVSQATASAFRTDWGLPDTVKVLGGNTHNIGRNDAVKLWDGSTLVDSLTYNDQAAAGSNAKGPRTDTASAWPSSSGVIGTDNASAWTRSTANDAEHSWTSSSGFIGSPGISQYGTGIAWVRINEVTSAGSNEPVELVNLAPVAVTVSTWKQTDSDNGHVPATLVGLSAPSIPSHGYVTFTSNQGLSAGGDAVRLYYSDGTSLLDSVTWTSGQAEPGSFSRCADGTGASFMSTATSTFGAVNDCSGSGTGGGTTTPPDPANAHDISINEVTSANNVTLPSPLPVMSDVIELYNSGTSSVDLTGWKQIDDGAASAATDFSGRLYVDGVLSTTIPSHGYGVFHSGNGLSGGGDKVKIYTAAGTPIDELDYTDGQAGKGDTVNTDGTYQALAACPDGSDTFLEVTSYSFGSSNAAACATGVPPLTAPAPEAPCQTENSGDDPGTVPATALTWPGSATPTTIDPQCSWVTTLSGQDLSGLAFDPSNANVLYAVKNKSHVYRLVNTGGTWAKDTANGWSDGKDITFPDGSGQPDSEGLTVGPDGMLYITTERDNLHNTVALDTILRFDPTSSATTLMATDEWDLTSAIGFTPTTDADANLGFEGVTYVPDSFLVSKGFRTDAGALYDPAAYAGKALPGLFFGAVEKTGHLIAYALKSDHTFSVVADISSGLLGVMDAQYDADLGEIWAHCDNTCGNATGLLKIGADGHFTVDRYFARPANLPNYNLEGFAVAPASTAVGGQRQVLWTDDGNRFGHSLWAGTLPADLPLPVVTPSTLTPGAGQSITLTVNDLTPNTSYQAVLHSTPVLLGSGTTNASGVLSLKVTIPASTPLGAHVITIAPTADPTDIVASIAITVSGTLAETGVTPELGFLGGGLLLIAGVGAVLGRRRLRIRLA